MKPRKPVAPFEMQCVVYPTVDGRKAVTDLRHMAGDVDDLKRGLADVKIESISNLELIESLIEVLSEQTGNMQLPRSVELQREKRRHSNARELAEQLAAVARVMERHDAKKSLTGKSLLALLENNGIRFQADDDSAQRIAAALVAIYKAGARRK